MRAGDLRHRVEIQRPTNTQNALGETAVTWSSLDRAWAEVKPLSGTELYKARQATAEVTHQITMRWRAGITPALRIFFNSRYFEILSAINVEERNRELQLLCKEHING